MFSQKCSNAAENAPVLRWVLPGRTTRTPENRCSQGDWSQSAANSSAHCAPTVTVHNAAIVLVFTVVLFKRELGSLTIIMSSAAAVPAHSASAAGGLISLKHIKASATEPTKAPRLAWPGGRVVSNKAEATVKFLRRKAAKGLELSEHEKALLEQYADVVIIEEGSGSSSPSAAAAAESAVGKKRGRREKSEKSSATPAVSAPPVPLEKRLSMSLDDLVSKKPMAGAGSASKPGDAKRPRKMGSSR